MFPAGTDFVEITFSILDLSGDQQANEKPPQRANGRGRGAHVDQGGLGW